MTRRVQEMAWSDLRIVLAIGRAGSLSGAARELGCTHSTVYRNIQAIEDTVGVRFFERMPSGYSPTEAGQIALRFAERIETEFHALHREVAGRDAELRGHVVVTGPEHMVQTMLPEMLVPFLQANPRVTVELVADRTALDLQRREADIAIRATRKPPENALGRRIGDFCFGFYASPDYLARCGERPLAELDFVVLSDVIGWLVPHPFQTRAQAEDRIVLRTNAYVASLVAARRGLGVVPASCYSADTLDDLVRIGLYDALTLELWVLTHPDLRHSARVKALMAFLVEALQERSALFAGQTGVTRPQ